MTEQARFEKGHIVKMRWFVAPDFNTGDQVIILEVRRATIDWRYYIVKESNGVQWKGWVDEEALAAPMEMIS
jgi:hypothetical protein